MLADLSNRIATLPPIAALVDILYTRSEEAQAGGPLVRAAPLVAAARPAVVAALARQLPRPLLYVVHTSDAAVRAVDELRHWLGPERVLLLPANDTWTYEQVAPGAAVRRQRLRVLQRLLATQDDSSLPAPLIVAPIRALLQPTLTPSELADATTTIQVNQWLGLDTLLKRWLGTGYQAVPVVEEPGHVARRGGIVDIWPVTDEQPLRIEWFGDEIDSLRRFDAQNQRSEERLQAAVVGPAYELPLWNQAHALERARALETGFLRPEAREQWYTMLEHLETGNHDEGWWFLAPFLFRADETPANRALLGHLPPGATVLFSEALLLAQAADEFHMQAEERRADLLTMGELPSDFPRPYLLWHELRAQMLAAPLVLADLSNNEDPPLDGVEPAFDRAVQVPLQMEQAGGPLFGPADLFGGQLRRLVQAIVARLQAGEHVVVVTPQAARIQELVNQARAGAVLDDNEAAPQPAPLPVRKATAARAGWLSVVPGTLDSGWQVPDARLTLYTDTEIFGWRQRRSLAERQRIKARSADERAAFLRGLQPGDHVVHIEHGIAVYEGLLRRTVDGVEREYLSLRYAAGDRLYVPVDQVDRVARYVGSGDGTPQLTRLGTQEWERAKRKARAAVRDMADELLAIYARREAHTGHAFAPDNEWQHELEDAFPYIETGDQLRAQDEIKRDMESPRPMDRLMCGDVGFGKTEVALRAAFKAVQDGKQVAVLVPTTVLAQQHYTTFTQRMTAFPLEVEMLSRFRTTREQTAILQRLARGQIDIVVGTHRLLSKDVRFRDLGLLIVDEEQRFGVRHKERLKQMRAEVDVLTLTATPIPRTLHMTLAGIRDMSVINTPPEDRLPIKTYVVPHNDTLIRDAIRRELDRGGQVYFVHNRVYSIYHVAAHLRTLVPEAAIGVGHGQLDERDLEQTMFDFFEGRYDVLVCTTIIENGLDVPNTNTIIIDDATNYGLAQLYQLRGRVGRSASRAYAYLLYRQDKPLSTEAQQRLAAIQEATELGSGFRIAMRDLEIRGAGNLLGGEQSGHIAAVGFDLYSRLLEQAVQQIKQEAASGKRPAEIKLASQNMRVNEKVLVSPLVTLDLPLTAYLPTDYITDETVRLEMYQRMVGLQSAEEVHVLRQELRDRFGEVPQPTEHLLTWLQIKALSLKAGVSSIVTSSSEFIIRLPVVDEQQHQRIQRYFGQRRDIRVGPQFVRLDRRATGENWEETLTHILEVLGRQSA